MGEHGGWGESGWASRSPCIPVRAGAQTADSERPILRVGPLLIDPVFSSAWARLITFQTPLPFTTDEGANNNLEFLVWVSAKSQPKRRFVSWRLAFQIPLSFFLPPTPSCKKKKKRILSVYCVPCVRNPIISLDRTQCLIHCKIKIYAVSGGRGRIRI